ncbi:hypothetical protein C8N43_3069 [Litoreibacter ponti]|uniref:Uncharacterized protein n=1 Tax=Litoreibacter ponti TaxID=1510457 RepID=A0A2T6BDX9_9RHOB|nr:hypothetical protein [Litoreibacter ponti]PTX54256.1 hypothetical protein C8N43_3069 [Litoreibacter ponti]
MKETFEAIKLGLQTLVYAAILVLIVSLFVRPDLTAERAGAFFKAFQDHNINIKIAALGFNISPQEVKELTDQSSVLDEVKISGGCLSDANCDAEEMEQLAALLEIENVTGYLRSEDQLSVTTTEDGEVSVAAVPGNAPVVIPDWLVVLGADRTLEAAQDEQQFIEDRLPGTSTDILRRDGWYRTVVYFDSADAANLALPGLERASRQKGIYVRATQIWCKGQVLQETGDYISCGES